MHTWIAIFTFAEGSYQTRFWKDWTKAGGNMYGGQLKANAMWTQHRKHTAMWTPNRNKTCTWKQSM